MKINYFNDTNTLNSVGYHFARFRRGRRHNLRFWSPGEFAAEKKKRFKLMVLYYMGVLLMFVGFLICFNAAYRNPDGAEPVPAVVTQDATMERAGVD